MSKFNTSNTNTQKTTNRSGYPAYKMADKEHLVTAVLTTMFGEPKYYGSTDNDIVRLATQCAKADPEFLCKLACYARNVGNMRSVSHVLTAVISRECPAYTRVTIRNVVVRPDDITEIMSCYASMYGKPFPNAMKREIASVMQKFNEYQIAKYNGGNKALKFRDVLRITHPVPSSQEVSELFGKILSDTLETPYTWEVELSTRGNTKEVWNELIASGKVGYMALLRNLRNIVKCGANVEPVLATLSDPVQVKKSRQLPFRFYSAYRTLKNEGMMTPAIHKALEKALTCSTENLEVISGRTLIALDVSGSMSQPVSKKSDICCCDIGAVLAALSTHLCEDATVCCFDSASGWYNSGKKGYRIEKFGKYDSVLSVADKLSFHGGGTDLSLPMKYALMEDESRNIRPFDRVIYISDNECNSGIARTVQHLADDYRRRFNSELFVHAIDMQGYGTQQFIGKRTNVIAGWSEAVLSFISTVEAGISTLVDTIAKYEVK